MCNYKKLKKLIRNMVTNNRIDTLNFGYRINIDNEYHMVSCSIKQYDDFFNEFFKNNEKYKDYRSVVENNILYYAAKEAYKIRKSDSKSKTIGIGEVKKGISNVLNKTKRKKHNCIFTIDGLLYRDDEVEKKLGDHILITNKDITTKYLSEVKVNQDDFKKKSYVIKLTSQSYNYKDAVILSKKVANTLANFLNILGIVKMGVITRVSIGYNDDWIYDIIDYDEYNGITVGNSFPDRQFPFDLDYLGDNVCETIDNILSKILKREKITSFDEILILAVNLIGSAITSENKPYSYFKCVSALECFFEKKENEGDIEEIILNKTNNLLSMFDRYNEYSLPGDFYANRSIVAHGDILDVSDQDLFIMKKISSIVLIIMLQNYDKFNVDDFKKEINSYINENKKE